jgi:hypothetical protein
MCEKCDGFNEEIKIGHPHELHNLLDDIKEIINEKAMSLEESNCNIDDIERNKPWPDDLIELVLKCSYCGQKFVLSVETYHGSGGSWKPLLE